MERFFSVHVYRTSDDSIHSITHGLDTTNRDDVKNDVRIEEDQTTLTKDTFLDPEYSIREDGHERFKRYETLFLLTALSVCHEMYTANFINIARFPLTYFTASGKSFATEKFDLLFFRAISEKANRSLESN